MTVTALGGEALQQRQISSLADIAGTVPSLSFTNSANGTPVLTLRGVGFYETSLGAYPTVSVYLDEVPLPFPTLTTRTAFDLERIEVLKGPQGTLFGQNATGGALNYIAAKPTNALSAGLNLSYSRFDTIQGDGYVSGPLSGNLEARLSFSAATGDGWQRSNSRNDTNGKTDYIAGRFLLAFEPSSGTRFTLNLNGWRDKSDTVAPQYVGLSPQIPAAVSPALVATPFSPENPRAADWSPGLPPEANNRFLQAALRGDIDLTDAVTLTTITSYADYRHRQSLDGDGTQLSVLDIPNNDGRIKSFSQELRLSNSKTTQPLQWVIGANYGNDKVFEQNYLVYPDSSAAGAFGISSSSYSADQKMKNYAVFGNTEYEVTGMLTLKAGARYTKAKRHANLCNFDTNAPYATGNFFYYLSSLFGNNPFPYVSGACFALDQNNGYQPGRFSGDLNEDNISWRVGADFKPADRLLLYANLSKGYKAGSFPSLSASTFAQYAPVVQESVLAYEGGFKYSTADRTFSVNGALYYYDYKNKQLRSKVIDPVFGILDNLQNIPRSTVKGAEIELTMKPTEGFTTTLAYTYTDAKIEEYVGVNAAGQAADFAGAKIPYAPKHQIGLNSQYEFPVSANLNAMLGGTLSFRSDTVAVVGGDALAKIDAYTTVDLRAGLSASNDRWSAEIWGKNVFNAYYWDNVVAAYDVIVRYPAKPATYGITLRHHY
ncbi:TonB-dependent receptor domain-containing protein [Sphingobium sp.]|uniref:TonB-dependent receptor n=1 Tax=Sphingobium sp. TaxID=1912891 RepID=UPI0028BD79CD|nr:TonB-dependent receptor [Sphingobium sp.]